MQHVNDDDTHIQLGDMDVQLIPVDPDENYKKAGVRDANLIAYTAKSERVWKLRVPGGGP